MTARRSFVICSCLVLFVSVSNRQTLGTKCVKDCSQQQHYRVKSKSFLFKPFVSKPNNMISFLFLDLRTTPIFFFFLSISVYDASCLYLSESNGGTQYYENRINNEHHKDKKFYSGNSMKYFSDIGTTVTPSTNVFETNNNNKDFTANFKIENNRSESVNKSTTELPFPIVLDAPPLNNGVTVKPTDTEHHADESGKHAWYISAFKFVRKLLIECRTKSIGYNDEETPVSYLTKMQRCAREKILMALDRALQADELRLSDTVFLVKDETTAHNVRYLFLFNINNKSYSQFQVMFKRD